MVDFVLWHAHVGHCWYPRQHTGSAGFEKKVLQEEIIFPVFDSIGRFRYPGINQQVLLEVYQTSGCLNQRPENERHHLQIAQFLRTSHLLDGVLACPLPFGREVHRHLVSLH